MEKIINEYLNWKGVHAPRASITYKIWLHRWVEICGDKPVKNYTTNDIVKFKQFLDGRFSPYYIQYGFTAIKNFFKYCKDNDIKCMSPSNIRIKKVFANSHRAITEDEVNRMIQIIPSNDFRSLRNLIIIRMLWETGVRVSELCSLDVSQIEEKKMKAVIMTKKTNARRIILWSKETHRLLMKYLPIRLELENIHRASALFIGFNNTKGWSLRLTSRSIERIVGEYALKARIKGKTTPHSFRHGWAHKRRDENAPLAFIQRGLGHSNPVSTFIYQQYNDVEFEKNARSFL